MREQARAWFESSRTDASVGSIGKVRKRMPPIKHQLSLIRPRHFRRFTNLPAVPPSSTDNRYLYTSHLCHLNFPFSLLHRSFLSSLLARIRRRWGEISTSASTYASSGPSTAACDTDLDISRRGLPGKPNMGAIDPCGDEIGPKNSENVKLATYRSTYLAIGSIPLGSLLLSGGEPLQLPDAKNRIRIGCELEPGGLLE